MKASDNAVRIGKTRLKIVEKYDKSKENRIEGLESHIKSEGYCF